MTKRRSLTPSPEELSLASLGLTPSGDAAPSPEGPESRHARRAGGARKEVSARVSFTQGSRELMGWALNQSRGGLRAIVEDPVELGEVFEVVIGDEPSRLGRIVWLQEEPDGAIVGVSFVGDSYAPPPSEPPSAPEASSPGPSGEPSSTEPEASTGAAPEAPDDREGDV
jgi:hypothetical protein